MPPLKTYAFTNSLNENLTIIIKAYTLNGALNILEDTVVNKNDYSSFELKD